MNVLVACETSGVVREAFRKLGCNAWSCDLLPSDDNSPYHTVGDARYVISEMIADDGRDMVPLAHNEWDIVVAHPPCTHLASSGARHFAAKRADGRQKSGVDLFMQIVEACGKFSKAWAVENPIGVMSRIYRKPDQIVQPWQFGHGETKATCLWLHNLPKLLPTRIVPGREPRIHRMPPSKNRWKLRSKTYQGIADAMADQWAGI